MKKPVLKVCILALTAWFWSVPGSFAATGPVTITGQPQSQRIYIGDPVTFVVGVDGTSPFFYQWLRDGTEIPLATGSLYTIASTAAGDDGARFSVVVSNSFNAVTSEVAVLSIDPGIFASNAIVFVPINGTWRYNQSGANLGTAWKEVGYNDTVAGWLSGPGVFDAKSTGARSTIAGEVVGTQLSLGAQPAVNDTTNYYFRTHFNFTNQNVIGASLVLNVILDDGAALYLNGQELQRIGVDPGATAATWANRTVGDPSYESFELPATALVNGDNVLAAEVHQINLTSSDITFGCVLQGRIVTRARDTLPPVVVNVVPLTNSTVRSLDQIEVLFSEPVANVDVGDLLINGVPATDLTFGAPGQFLFTFPQPPTGAVVVSWAPGNGIQDLAAVPNAFAGGSWTYTFDPNAAFSDIRISEFMADNENGIRDEDGTHQDWIELYNATLTTVDLSGWYLTDDAFDLTKWTLPANVAMAPNTYLLVWASGKDRTNIFAPLHTNFKLSKSGGFLGLVLPDGTNVVSSFAPYPSQQTDVSYGRDRLDPSIVGYYTTPTPAAPNASGGAAGFASDVVYSRASGTFVAPFNLTLSTRSTNAVIRFVLITNAAQASIAVTNIPTTNSPIYTSAIPIVATTQVRARAFEPGLFPSAPLTESYIQISTNVLNFSSDRPLCVVHSLGATPQVSGSAGVPLAGILMLFDKGSSGTNRSSLTNAPQVATRMSFHLRGSSTLTQAKSNYKVEYWDEYNQDIKLPFLDMPDESDWVLYGIDGFDPGLMHNAIYHWFGHQLPGQFASRTRYVEVFRKIDTGPVTTNDYFGLYLVEESPKISKVRLDIPNLDLENTNPPSVTGGYLMRIDRAGAAAPIGYNFSPPAVTLQSPQVGTLRSTPAPVNIDDPKIYTTTTDPRLLIQANYLRNYIQAFTTNLASVNYRDPVTGYAQFIDPDQWIDHLIGNIICFNVDGYRLSGYFFKDRNDRLKQGPYWDCDRCMGTGGTTTPQADNRCFSPRYWRLPANDLNTDNGTDFFGLSNIGVSWFERLFRDPDFWQNFIDRYQMFRTNQYSTNAIFAMIDGFYNEIKEAQVREQARWGPAGFNWPRSGVQTVNGYSFDFGPADNLGRGRFTNEVNFQKKWFVDRLEFMDTNFLGMPTLSSGTALVPSGTLVTVTPAAKANTLLLYTLNGTDPRLPGGAVSPLARTNAGTLGLTVTSNVQLFVRCYNTSHANMTNSGTEVGKPLINSFWSGPASATYYTTVPSLRITELMYHPGRPAPGDTNDVDNFEYVELTNVGGGALSLIGFHFTDGIEFAFTATNSVTSLAPGGRVLVVKNRAAFVSRYPALAGLVAGEFVGNLDNAGERVALAGPLGEPIHDFKYDNNWYPATDGVGFSLVIANESASLTTWTNAAGWRPSAYDGGSPGAADPVPTTVLPVIVNEILTQATPPAADAIELWNPNPTPVNIGYWYLTDNQKVPRKYLIPSGTTLPGFGFAVFYETNSFGVTNVANALGKTNDAFGLSANGEEVYVFSGDNAGHLTGYLQGFDFGPAAPDVTFGRYVDSLGQTQYVAQSANTLGATNAYPLVGPVVINEIMYHPPDLFVSGALTANFRDEFIELRNISGAEVLFYDTSYPANRWTIEKAVDFTFPIGASLPPNGYALVVSFDPAQEAVDLVAFRARYGLSDTVPIYGPYSGHLADEGERLELRKPGLVNPNTGLAPMVLVDRVDYLPTNPWPATASGTGASLQRRVASEFGNDPANWLAAGPSAGGERVSGTPPTITAQPQPLTVPEESGAAFTVSVDGTGPFLYQWFFNGIALDGAYAPSLVLTNVQLDDAGAYSVLVLSGSGTALSSVAALTVQRIPVILQNPASTNIVLTTNIVNLTLGVSAVGTGGLSYQWQYQSYTDADYANILGETASTLVLNNIQPADSGRYRVMVTDSIGTRTSLPAVINVSIRPAITQQPSPVNQAVAVGETATIHVEVSGTRPLGCRWRKNGATYVAIGEETLTMANVALTNAANYDVIVTNLAGGTSPATSARAYLVVVAPPTNQTVLPATNVTLRAIVATPAGFTNRFSWLFNDASVLREGTNSVGSSPALSLFTNDLVLTNLQAGQVGNYTFLLSNAVTVTNLTTTNVYVVNRSFTARLAFLDTNAPVVLAIELQGTNAVIRWDDSPATWTLEEATDLTPPPNWQPSGATPVLGSGRWEAVVPVAEQTNRFFRLRRP